MASHSLVPLLQGTKVRITALCQHDDSLYVGCADGSLRVYSLGEEPKLEATHTLGKRPIDQLAVLSAVGQLAVLSDSTVSLHKLTSPTGKGNITVLSQARYAHTFATTTYFASSPSEEGSSTPAKVQRDLLVIGCRKKVMVYGAGRVLGEPWELALPHSPRTILFPLPMYADLPTVHLLYSPSASALLKIQRGPKEQRLSVTDLPSTGYPTVKGATLPAPEGGFGTLNVGGLWRSAAVPVGTRTVGGEVVLVRDELGVFFSSEGQYTRDESLQFPAAPEAMAFANPNIYSVIPAASGPPSIQVHLAPTLTLRQSITFPTPSIGSLTVSALNVGVKGKRKAPRMLLVSTPTDKTSLQTEGSTVWEVQATDVGDQVDELVKEGRLTDAIGLVETVGDEGLHPTQQLPHLKVLRGLAQFAQGEYKDAIEAFIVHNVHPAKVVALYPRQAVSGNLAVPKEEWMTLFGAEGARLEPPTPPVEEEQRPAFLRNAHLALGRKRSSDTLSTMASSTGKEDKEPPKPTTPPPITDDQIPRPAIDELIYYLSDRRQKLTGAIAALGSPLPKEDEVTPLSELPADQVHRLPDGPLTELDPEELLRTAQVIYTSLLKVYLVARPSLVGSLCRIENWCDVAEVEPLLREKGRIDDLRDLYMQKNMHDKALSMLLEQAKEEDDPLDRYPPTIRYLQKLGPKHLQLIFDSSSWIFDEDPKRALQIFTADEPEVDALPRDKVVAFLERKHWQSAMAYLEHVVELGETSADLHDKLAELHLMQLRDDPNQLPSFLNFLNSSTHYRAYRILQLLQKHPKELPEAKAVLLGRLGKHDEALKIYVYQLQDYIAAEAYCTRTYPTDKGIFQHLLTLYLRPNKTEPLIEPALALIAKQGTRIPPDSVLDLLPPLVPLDRLHAFLLRTLGDERTRRNEHRITKGLLSARKSEVERLVCGLEVKRVRVTEQRTCPLCLKRLGTSAVAVHAPRGEVTHLHCKDQFSAKLQAMRA